ncbi:uncharacterized protein LOC135347397 isoform X3 [Halichondria panicea]|uniref:uncharacterized protein LOC135347397 isoform X3 n=1 Tax=Halichondria panicea TaxID=6063 RepID=UPI00312BC2E0
MQFASVCQVTGCESVKRHLELFLDSYGLQSLMQSAGVDCLTSLCQLLGRMIFRGRIEQQIQREQGLSETVYMGRTIVAAWHG